MIKLVIIGANDFQNQLILKAKARGIQTHVFAWECGDVGEETADYFYPVSIIEKEKILEICREIKPDGVISIASDLASITVNYIAEKLGLTGNGMESVGLSTNKYNMRKAFKKNNDPIPEHCRSDELTEEVLEKFNFPLIVKPVDRSGSRGITKINSKAELRQAVDTAKELSFDKQAMIEEYVEGSEYSVEYISYEGRHYFLALTEKYTTGAPHFIEKGHMQPAEVSEITLNNVRNVVEHALDSLKIRYGASHSEIKIDENGVIKIIEIGGRMGGDCIGSDLVRLSTGYDYVNMVIDVALGIKPSFNKVCEPGRASVHFIFEQEDIDMLEEIRKNSPDMIYRTSNIEPFKKGHKVIDSSTRYGYYIIRE